MRAVIEFMSFSMLVLLTTTSTMYAIAATIVVTPDGTGDAPTIQAAIDVSSDGDTVLLSNGVFVGPGNRDIDFRGRAITLRSQSGDPNLCIVDCEGSPSSPHRGFFFHSGEDTTSKVLAITIQNGYDAGVFNTGGGGGIRFEGSSPLIRNCRIVDCEAFWVGGGIACYSASPAFEDCVFAGSIRSPAHLDHSDAIFERCTFSDNDGEIHLWASSPFFIQCTMSHNTSGTVSALFSDGGSSPVLDRCIVAFGNLPPFQCNNSSITLLCCNLFGNQGGDYVMCVDGQLNQNENFSADPMFCDAAKRDFRISSESPCAPSNSPCEELVGSLGVGCGPGACCFGALCTILTPDECGLNGGAFIGGSCEFEPCAGTGACCMPDGSCQLLSVPECVVAGGELTGISCAPNPCPQPGACCSPDGGCTEMFEADCLPPRVFAGEGTTCGTGACLGACCLDSGPCALTIAGHCAGEFLGIGSLCDPSPCPPPGACCPGDGTCVIEFETPCVDAGGVFLNGSCEPNPCPPAGACCFPSGNCTLETGDRCSDSDGAYSGDGTSCDPNPCPTLGACCFNTICFLVEAGVCADNDGEFLGGGTICSPGFCQSAGSCCLDTGECRVTSQENCASPSGVFSPGTDCQPNPCGNPSGACCSADGTCSVIAGIDCVAQSGMFLADETCDPSPCSAASVEWPLVGNFRPIVVYPNPTSDHVDILLHLEERAVVAIDVIDVSGRLVRRIDRATRLPGDHSFDVGLGGPKGLASGIYYLRFQIGGATETRKITLSR